LDKHYEKLGLVFPSEPITVRFGEFGHYVADAIFIIAKKFSLLQTTFLSCLLFCLNVDSNLEFECTSVWNLLFAVPLSLLEAFLASFSSKC